jgi:putative PIN family toxin of toxin-antitoxin system
MRPSDRIVIDTNVFVSATMLRHSIPRQTVDRVLDSGIVLLSEATLAELAEVLSRPKFDVYASVGERALFLRQVSQSAEFIPIIQTVRECRDPDDDRILEVALNGCADVIVTGDEDLLSMNPWREIKIVSPVDYLKLC